MRALGHVLWIGGPPGAGKSTVAARIARRHGLRWYGADTRTWQHRDRALRAGNPAARRWEAISSRGRWVDATPREMFDMSLHRERAAMVIDDLRALPTSPLVVGEGTTLPASAVSSGLAERSRVVWLMPTPEFQRAALAHRHLEPGPAALYRFLTATIEREVAEHGVPTLTVDRGHGVAQTVAAVEEMFRTALTEGPRADGLAERRALLCEANDAVARQVCDYYRRSWAVGDARDIAREFWCECGDVDCDATVVVPVGAKPPEGLFAPGHGVPPFASGGRCRPYPCS